MLSEIVNIILGILSIAGLVSGFFIEEYRITFWIVSIALLIFVVIGYYVANNRDRIFSLTSKIKRIEESLNIYDRLNRLENKVFMKKGQVNLLEIIKWILAAILIYVFIEVIKSFR